MQQTSPGWGDLIKVRPRTTNTQISRGRTAFISDHNGDAHAEHAIEGMYVYDTRVLSSYAWTLNGKTPEFSCGSPIQQSTWMAYYVQVPENWKETPTHESDPLQQTIELRLIRSVGEGMHEDVHLSNHTQIATDVKLELHFEHAFESQTEAEDGRKQHGKLELTWSQPSTGVWEQMADYKASHHYRHQGNVGTAHLHRGLCLRVENATSAPETSDNRLTFRIQLAPHEEWHVCLSWMACVEGKLLPLAAQCSRVDSSDWDLRRTRFFNSATSFSVPHADDLSSLVYRVLRRARLDMGDLRMYDRDSPGGIAVAAGVPTYMEVFGRDLQASGWAATLLSPEFLRGSLNVLSKLGATETNDWRDAQPGRIPHEIHTDPLSVLNFRPKSLYFGAVSGSFLLPISVSELWHWTGDLDSVRPYVHACMNAIAWADKYSLDETGFYRYQTRSEQGVKNQGWKDSNDAIVYPDGSQVEAPIGTSEMQAFMYVAKLHFSEVMWRLGQADVARRLFTEAEDLKKRFNEKFWMEDEGFYAMGIDNKGELIRSIASDAGHCVLAGIVDESRVKRTVNRLMRDDLFSGWGIRTLSADHAAFNPFSYHRGTVWPVTNAVFVLAFSRYGLHGEMHRLAKAMFEAASLFEHDRLPEVFGGHQRRPDLPFPGMYTRADWPQAWSASAPFLILQALLGIYPYAPADLLFIDPHLPEWLPEITVERLRIGKAVVSLRFRRNDEGRTDYDITSLEGTLHVLRQPSPWSLTSGWAERTRDVLESLLPHRKAS
ncbi:MAG TPA: glycogen debranching N-terminal domain-containing protein [Acidobacteriaceae bacterium]|nr:glycogen debranching N-terminal domain-containing protein [Acidobacteriaceae bacterium]